MKSPQKTKQGPESLAFNEANIAKVEGLQELLASFTKRNSVSYSSDSTLF